MQAPPAEGQASSFWGKFAPHAEGAGSLQTLRAESKAAIDVAVEAAHQATGWVFSDNMVPQEEAMGNQLDDRNFSPRGSLPGCLPGVAQYPAFRMWARINVAEFQQTNRVNLMQIDMLSLGVLHTQMGNLTMQSTLMIGFAMTMFAGGSSNPLVDDQSQVCVYKSWYHMLFGLIFFMSVTTSTSCGLILVVITSFIKQATQEAALIVSTGAAVAMTRKHLDVLRQIFMILLTTFTFATGSLFILYVALPKRIEQPEPTASSSASSSASNATGRLLAEEGGGSAADEVWRQCIDHNDPADHASVRAFGTALGVVMSSILLLMGINLIVMYRRVRRSYEPKILMEWYRVHSAEEQTKVSRLHAVDMGAKSYSKAVEETLKKTTTVTPAVDVETGNKSKGCGIMTKLMGGPGAWAPKMLPGSNFGTNVPVATSNSNGTSSISAENVDPRLGKQRGATCSTAEADEGNLSEDSTDRRGDFPIPSPQNSRRAMEGRVNLG